MTIWLVNLKRSNLIKLWKMEKVQNDESRGTWSWARKIYLILKRGKNLIFGFSRFHFRTRAYRTVPNEERTGTNRYHESLFWKSYSSKLPFGFVEFNDPKYRDWFLDCSNICRNSASVGGIVFSWISLKYAEGNEL